MKKFQLFVTFLVILSGTIFGSQSQNNNSQYRDALMQAIIDACKDAQAIYGVDSVKVVFVYSSSQASQSNRILQIDQNPRVTPSVDSDVVSSNKYEKNNI
jgi:hypothetical protein